MQSRFTSAVFCACLLFVTLSAQDPLKTLPDSYTLQFENELVRVVRVHYAAGAMLAEHTHPRGLTAFVYLNDAGSVAFTHSSGGTTFTNTRAPVNAGDFAVVFSSAEEVHTVENANSPSDFLRIQIKTSVEPTAGMRLTPRTRFTRGTHAAGENTVEQQFANDKLVVTRFIIAPERSMDIERSDPSLLISIPSGETRWLGVGGVERIANGGTTPMELLRMVLVLGP